MGNQRYHIGYVANPFRDKNRDGEIRNTLYGYGIAEEDVQAFNGDIMFRRTEMHWGCNICNYAKNEYRRHRVFGHVMAQHT